MNIALLISGEVRTFVLKEQILFFKKLLIYLKQFYEMVDVFMVLKIPDNKNALIKSDIGLKHFKYLCGILCPKYLYCFYDFNQGIHTEFNIQLKMIDMCIVNALEYQKQNKLVYNTFFRIRPDSCFLLNELDIINKQNCSIYTSIKSDALANDQIIIINRYVLYTWWFFFVKKLIKCPMKFSPEYTIYKGYKSYLVSNFQNWLIRGYNDVKNWDKMAHMKLPLSSEYKFNYMDSYNKMLIDIPQDVFIKELKKIPNIKLDTYIDYT